MRRLLNSPITKRVLDLTVSAALFLPLLLVGMVVALTIRSAMGSPVFFRQDRPGLNGRIFGLLKFRTMLDTRDAQGQLLPDWERLHPVGSFVRRFSLDELPQLYNVIRGDMSLVGPRPLLPSYLDRYTPEQARRHSVRPGITGWAQIHGRQEIPFSERLRLDVWYVDHRSLGLDLRILAATAIQVLRRSGVKPGQDVRDVDDLGLNDEASPDRRPG